MKRAQEQQEWAQEQEWDGEPRGREDHTWEALGQDVQEEALGQEVQEEEFRKMQKLVDKFNRNWPD